MSGMFGLLVFAACAPLPSSTSTQLALEPSPKEERISTLEVALADALIEIEKMKAREPMASGADALPAIPPNAETGRCYAKLLAPPNYIDRIERRIVKEASERRETLPARLEWFDEQVLVSEAHVRLTVVPATYKWQEERTQVVPSKSRQMLVTPARYNTVVEEVTESPEEWVWRPGRGDIEKIDEESGEIVHQVYIPTRYRQIKKQILVEPAKYRKVVEPAVYETVRKKVVDVPEHTIEERIPAKYKSVKAQRVIEPEREVTHYIAPVYKEFSYREKVTDAKLAWRMVPCERDLNKELVYKIQRALRKLGYDTGGVDGVLGKYTLIAIHDFQKQKGLATGRLSSESIQALGLEF
ncbi:peptidoglycan-binding domain-containing protein [Zhongshania aliphaticivorans]|uniref:peptidoglycan-binding domain-containing protein n=1 Tax=Zhongshania aliphaticivorans TaxID=1470434 RepID=UPI0012E41450|nr:peptidoglycan-binding domain-containing protein [Zhongshania aliphaticivorans]CAA0083104.1 Uncharacterised protein [Zhongshania aliphaticivorans]